MTAFVDQYDYDLFVSYASVNDKPMYGEPTGWVSQLVNQLTILLDERLGRTGLARIWKDELLRGNAPFPEDIESAVRSSAALLIVFSEGYRRSDWCRRELDLFLESVGGMEKAAGRLFVVYCDECGPEEKPEALRNLRGYKFYETPAKGQTMPLGVRGTDEDAYCIQLNTLRWDLAKKLKEMEADETLNLESASSCKVSTPSVFLAEVTSDLKGTHEQVRRYMLQAGIPVVPQKTYPATPQLFEEAMHRDIAENQCAAFVQLLSCFETRKAEDLPKGYDGLQLELARSAEIEIFRWRSPDLDLSKATDRQRDFITDDDVIEIDLEEFKQYVVKKMQSAAASRSRDVPVGDPYVLLSAKDADVCVADEIGEELIRRNVAYEVVDDATPLKEAISKDVHGLMVIYGECPQRWVKDQILPCRPLMMSKNKDCPCFAVYIAPPELKKKRLGFGLPLLQVIRGQLDDGFDSFVNAVTTRSAAACT